MKLKSRNLTKMDVLLAFMFLTASTFVGFVFLCLK